MSEPSYPVLSDTEISVSARVHSLVRLSTVRSLQILDSPNEEVFDRMTRLATNLLRAPASFLSIVDADRDFYKSQASVQGALAAERELTGRTFCHYTLSRTEPLVIQDTHADERWRAVPTVLSLGVRAYVGVPLTIKGQSIGSLCVIDTEPRVWTHIEIETLEQLAKSAEREIELRSMFRSAHVDAIRLQDAAKLNEELVASIVHDLRTPLQVVSLVAGRLERSADANSQREGRRVGVATTSMKRMVEDLLSADLLDGTVPGHPADLAVTKLLHDALEIMEPVCGRAGLSVSLDTSTRALFHVDYVQLLRALCNLIGNCVKYCPAGSAVNLTALESPGWISICVQDNGPGMSGADQEHAFESGWQGGKGTARKDGSGLGLTIVRRLIETNGGQVELQSECHKGTSVTLGLPTCANEIPRPEVAS